MKTRTLQVLSCCLIIMGCFACKQETVPASLPQSNVGQEELYDGVKTIAMNESSIVWKGHKLIGTHTGEIQLIEGVLEFEKGVLKSGRFTADMTSIRATELMKDDEDEEEEEEGHDDREDLSKHLKAADFFDVETYPEATFEMTEVTKQAYGYLIKGDMTIKNVTQQIRFPAQVMDGMFKASATIDRTKFGIKYGSGSFFDALGDNVIKDEFDLDLALKLQ